MTYLQVGLEDVSKTSPSNLVPPKETCGFTAIVHSISELPKTYRVQRGEISNGELLAASYPHTRGLLFIRNVVYPSISFP